MTEPRRPDEDPIAATGQFQRFVDEAASDRAEARASRQRLAVLWSVIAAVVVVVVVVLLIVL